mmetsp:Transcript_19723/g.61211  ORF Transcript_19723/g.61211 Transcript_19723/m.61211 type:complete len:221 (+) Transcript_19723:195-857(+)
MTNSTTANAMRHSLASQRGGDMMPSGRPKRQRSRRRRRCPKNERLMSRPWFVRTNRGAGCALLRDHGGAWSWRRANDAPSKARCAVLWGWALLTAGAELCRHQRHHCCLWPTAVNRLPSLRGMPWRLRSRRRVSPRLRSLDSPSGPAYRSRISLAPSSPRCAPPRSSTRSTRGTSLCERRRFAGKSQACLRCGPTARRSGFKERKRESDMRRHRKRSRTS